MKRNSKIIAVIALLAVLGTGCAKTTDTLSETSVISTSETSVSATAEASSEESVSEQEVEIVTALAKIDNTKWQYNEADNVYWQVGISYCENPADPKYETLGIFVPGDYMTAGDNGDGTFTCEINREASVGNYTAMNAPVVIHVNTPGYSAMAAPTDYVDGVSDYTSAGFIYLNAGCRGRDDGAPAGVTDLKAAIRYLRYNEGNVPGSMDRIFTFGMSGGGAQSALVGATGDSELYAPYLEAIGAVQGLSDAVTGSMCWCPITNLDYANEAYEWNMGVTRTDLDEETQQLSDSMAEAFAEYINSLGLKDSSGNVLALSESEDGIYQSGSYYDYLVGVVEKSLNNFLADTDFPYNADSSGMKGGRGNFGGGLPNGMKEDRFEKDGLTAPNTDGNVAGENEFYKRDGIDRNNVSGGIALSGTYETAQDYIDALNADTVWITYNSETNTAKITSLADFVKACKNASKNVGAFDDLNAAQGENTLFGYGDGNGAHFDPIMAQLLKGTEYGNAYAADLSKTDALGYTVDERLNMYNPMYYLDDYYEGYRSANVARYWRIRTGINQGDTALCTEVNLALALENYGADVDFETVWGQGHVEAERAGSSTENFINWVNECIG